MIAKNLNTTEEDKGHPLQTLSIEKACEEYNSSVKLTLDQINHQLDDILLKNSNGLDELAVKIAARTNFLEKNPTFLSCLVYDKDCVKCKKLLEFDEIRITLKEHCKRIQEKLEEIERYHNKLLELVVKNGRGHKVSEEVEKKTQSGEDDFHDCLDEGKEAESEPEEPTTAMEEPTTSIEEPKVSDDFKVTFPVQNDFDRRPSKPQNQFDKVVITKNAFSERDLSKESPAKFKLFPDVIPDVQRRRPLEDLHGKLIQQLVATDSLEGFLKLMDRKPVQRTYRKTPDLERKYTNSLWFFSKDMKKPKPVTPRKTGSLQKNPKPVTSEALYSSIISSASQPAPLSNQTKTRKVRLSLTRNKLKYYDLLDDLDHNDLKPIQSEYPRRDNVHMKLHDAKSYLHRMMEENDKVWKTLLQPHEEKKRKVHHPEKKKLTPARAKQVRNLMEYLTAPEQKFYNPPPQTLIVMPVKVIYDNFPTKDNVETPRNTIITDLTKKIAPAGAFPLQRRKQMLDQLKGLKMRNDNIQKNIQKAIDVIETKMIDLLSSPNDATSSEAFNAMEKEITHVLKMMNDNEREKREMKVEPEKDDSPKLGSPKMKRALTTIKKPENDVKKRERSLERNDDKSKKRERSCEPPKFGEGRMQVEVKEVKKGHKVEEIKEVKKAPKIEDVKIAHLPKPKEKIHKQEAKKTANIEEGERLLGQVDTVIKKIDRIYNRFHDEKSKTPKFGDISEIFGSLNLKMEVPAILEYKYYEATPRIYTEPSTFYRIYYSPRLKYQPIAADYVKIEKGMGEGPKAELKRKLQGSRHDSTLQTFYTLFFSGVFVALNYDFAS